MGYVIAFVGPSRAGKTMLMDAVLERLAEQAAIIRSVTTRLQRNNEDAEYYEFVSAEEFERRIAAEAFAHHVPHAGNYYGTQKSDIDATLAAYRFGLGAYVEQGVMNLRKNGYTPKIIKVIPQHYQPATDPLRQVEDAERSRIDLGPDVIIENSFLPGGREQSVNAVLQFLATLR